MAATGRNDAIVMANIFILKLQLSVIVHSLSCVVVTLVLERRSVIEHEVRRSHSSHTMAPVTPGKLFRMSPGEIYFVCVARLAKLFQKQCKSFPFAFCIPVAWG